MHTESYLGHQRLEVEVMGLAHHPVSVARQGPAGDGPYQGLAVSQTANEVGHQLGKMGNHAIHAALSDGTQNQDAWFLNLPFSMEESLFQDGQQHWEYVLVEHIGQDIKSSCWALSCGEKKKLFSFLHHLQLQNSLWSQLHQQILVNIF